MLDFFVIFIIGISLSMDTFSLSIIYGTLGLENKKIYILSTIVGIYHFVMPFFGNLIGVQVLNKLPIETDIVVGIIFVIIAVEMFFQKDEILDLTKISALLLFGFTVSLDSFSVGIGISNIIDNYFIAYITFAVTSLFFTFIGLKFGNSLKNKFGNKATFFGAIILLILGVFYIF